MHEGNNNMIHDTTGNKTIMSYASVNENSKINSNPEKQKRERVIKLEKKTKMLGILCL